MSDELSVSDAKGQLGAIIDRARLSREPIYLSRRGRRMVAVIDAEEFERIRSLADDAEDAQAAINARAEMDATSALPVPWAEVKAELGLT